MTLRLKKNISDDERYAIWVLVIERIYAEHSRYAWNHHLFRLTHAVFSSNTHLSKSGGFIVNWVDEIYADSILMLLRRELDKQAGVENIRNLLSDMVQYSHVLTRKRYYAGWGKDAFDRSRRKQVFDSFSPIRAVGTPKEDHIDPKIVQRDLSQMVKGAEEMREYAERTRAHRSPKKEVDNASSITFQSLNEVISDIRKIIKKYYALLTLTSITRWEPVPQFDTIKPFMEPWVVDRDAVDKAERENNK